MHDGRHIDRRPQACPGSRPRPYCAGAAHLRHGRLPHSRTADRFHAGRLAPAHRRRHRAAVRPCRRRARSAPAFTAARSSKPRCTTFPGAMQTTWRGMSGRRFVMAAPRVPARVLQRTGVMLEGVLDALLPALLVAMGVLAAGITLGSLVGGAIGLLVGGVSALPGAVLGADLGLAFANALLVWAGLGFLVSEIAGGLPGDEPARRAWRATGRGRSRQGCAAIRHGSCRPRRTIWPRPRRCSSSSCCKVSSPGCCASRRSPRCEARWGASAERPARSGRVSCTAAADAAVAELVGRLRASRFGEGFAKWVEGNWRELVGNPRLQPREVLTGISSAGAPTRAGGELPAAGNFTSKKSAAAGKIHKWRRSY